MISFSTFSHKRPINSIFSFTDAWVRSIGHTDAPVSAIQWSVSANEHMKMIKCSSKFITPFSFRQIRRDFPKEPYSEGCNVLSQVHVFLSQILLFQVPITEVLRELVFFMRDLDCVIGQSLSNMGIESFSRPLFIDLLKLWFGRSARLNHWLPVHFIFCDRLGSTFVCLISIVLKWRNKLKISLSSFCINMKIPEETWGVCQTNNKTSLILLEFMGKTLKSNKNDPVAHSKSLNQDSIWYVTNNKIEMAIAIAIAKAESELRWQA
jgi:hypothetical protein